MLVPDPHVHVPETSPAAQELEQRIESVLATLLSPHIGAVFFLPAPTRFLPQLAPLSLARDAADRAALGCWLARVATLTNWREALRGVVQADCPELLERGEAGTFSASVVAAGDDACFGILALKFGPDLAPGDPYLDQGPRAGRLVGQTIQQWRNARVLELELAGETRRTQRLAQQAELDGLTRLLNNHAFKLKCTETLGHSHQKQALMMIDVDNFKSVNDIYGHHFGDLYLREVAHAIVRALPESAIVGRLGGDEFAALVPRPSQCEPYLERLMLGCATDVQRAAARLGKPNLGRVSIGCSIESEACPNVEKLMQGADAALYASKKNGKGVGAIFDPESHQNLSAQLMRPRFLSALQRREIQPFFQPVIALETGRTCGFEVLVRWQDPEKGLLGPSDFTSVLEAPELAEKLTRRLFADALEHFVRRPGYRAETLAINLGTVDLIKQEFVFDLQSLLDRYSVDWHQIVIEVTENTMLGPISGPVFQNLTELRSRGAKVALDDFGTGYGGLSHLRSWPVDIIKLDRSYVTPATRSPQDEIFARALIEIAQTLGLEVIAEGVETEETAALLRGLGCDKAQGFYFARPAPPDRF
ncbi:EAL domain-containing protein [Salipiger sp. P9]|uniref:putative bifunctional diguanylate cyclase/phosphodiesterase n=1 Tax=Salipiger pentaromativorans TaxID=2943193 RepID=UPI002157A16A|nr:EAL domain-containing protein [Salipiger pentaromativorans]MCR8549120.1 EAL domain-containing protein [Salipiger pentaromativorans]